MTFVVRLSRDATGRATGIVERVRTGEKERFEGIATIATLIARMVEADHIESEAEVPAPATPGEAGG
jgi:hypothetical protein